MHYKNIHCYINNATNVADVVSLKEKPPAQPVKKQLLLNMDELGIYTNNIEGVTFVPRLPNGNKTLLFISDNNFSQ